MVSFSGKNADVRYPSSELYEPQNCVLALFRYASNASIFDTRRPIARREFFQIAIKAHRSSGQPPQAFTSSGNILSAFAAPRLPAGGPLKHGFGLSEMFARHRLGPANKARLSCHRS